MYGKNAPGIRRFFRDTLGLRHVDAGGGWLIFSLPPAELGIHPTSKPGSIELYLMCDDIAATAKSLKRKGVKLSGIIDAGWGLLSSVKLPGAGEVGLYQPKHPTALQGKRRASRGRR